MKIRKNILLVDDDASVRESLANLLQAHDINHQEFCSGREFLNALDTLALDDGGYCILMDVRMPRMTGLEVQEHLKRRSCFVPMVFITAHGDIRMAVNAIKMGAFDFVTKPFDTCSLLGVIEGAIAQDLKARREQSREQTIVNGYQCLTPREKVLLELVLDGKLNKQISAELNISEVTVKVHRHNLMKKLGERSWAKIAVAINGLKKGLPRQ